MVAAQSSLPHKLRMALSGVLVLALGSGVVWAEPSPADRSTAEALFVDARKLASEGRFVEACPKFAESQRLDPGVGTLLYLAECYEKTARTASAWVTFREAADLARTNQQAAREKIALDRASALEPRLPKLVIELSKGAAPVKVTRDGAEVSSAVFGTIVPLDPGMHTVSASAQGKKTWTTSVELVEGKSVTVQIPVLEASASPAASSSAPVVVPPPTASSGTSPAPILSASPESSGGFTRKTGALIAGGVGVIGVGVGSYFGLRAQSLWDSSRGNCVGTRCGKDGYNDATRASNAARASSIFFLVGAAGLGVGAALWFWPESEKSTALRIGPGTVSLEGAW